MKNRTFWLITILFYAVGLYFFYMKYVPLINRFQVVLLICLSTVTIVTIKNVRWGLLFFIFCFPLINNLPYFFGIYEPLPHAPTALILFLFFFLGWLIQSARASKRVSWTFPIFGPMIVFSIFLLASALITLWRYANFFPFLGDHIYELIANTNGVTCGGAMMSLVFNSLNYLSGFAFFYTLTTEVHSKTTIKLTLYTLCASTFISLVFGLFQHLKNTRLGNNPLSFYQGIINATFKDAMSFGAFIAITTPLFLAVCLYYKGTIRILSFMIVMLSTYLVFFSGSKISLLVLFFSLFVFICLILSIASEVRRPSFFSFKNFHWSTRVIVVLMAIIVVFLVSNNLNFLEKITHSQGIDRTKEIMNSDNLSRVFQERASRLWKMALYMIRDYPATGVGIGAYVIELSNYSTLHHSPVELFQSAENYLLQVGAELGLIGVLLILWIFWMVVKEMRRESKKTRLFDRRNFILIGAAIGIISYFVIIQFHTFIGSYEINYTFWLLVGVIYCLARMNGDEGAGIKVEKHDHSGKHIRWSKAVKLSGIILIILYSSIHLWNSTHSLSLQSRTKLFGIQQDFGFYQVEKTDDGREFRWTRGYGGQTVSIDKPILMIPLLASHPDIAARPVKARIFLIKDLFKRKRMLGEIILTRNVWETYEYYIPEEVKEECILLIRVDRTWNPLKSRGIPDPRELGVAIGNIEFRDK